jgi:hypothetical protein
VQLAPRVGWLQVCAVCRGTGVGPAHYAGLMSGSTPPNRATAASPSADGTGTPLGIEWPAC